MIETIKYRWELRKLNKRREELERFYAEQKTKAKTAKSKAIKKSAGFSTVNGYPKIKEIKV